MKERRKDTSHHHHHHHLHDHDHHSNIGNNIGSNIDGNDMSMVDHGKRTSESLSPPPPLSLPSQEQQQQQQQQQEEQRSSHDSHHADSVDNNNDNNSDNHEMMMGVDISTPKPLNHIWSVYLNDNVQCNLNHTSVSLDANHQHLYDTFFQSDHFVARISTVQGFWKVWNALMASLVNHHHQQSSSSSSSSTPFAIKFFKNGINQEESHHQSLLLNALNNNNNNSSNNNNNNNSGDASGDGACPSSDDPVQPPSPPIVRSGGRWNLFSYDKSKRVHIWTELLLAVIGEIDYFGRRTFDVQGVMFQSHPTYDSVQLWNGVPQMPAPTAQKMMKRMSSLIKHVEDHGIPIAHIGEDVFIEYYKSHFGREFSFSSSRGGSGYSSPASRSGYSTPTLTFRKNSGVAAARTPQQSSPRTTHVNFHHKLKQKLQQRFPESQLQPQAQAQMPPQQQEEHQQEELSVPPSQLPLTADPSSDICTSIVSNVSGSHVEREEVVENDSVPEDGDVSPPSVHHHQTSDHKDFFTANLNLLIVAFGFAVAIVAYLVVVT